MTRAIRNIYQLKAMLRGSKPPIWRRFLTADTTSLPILHGTLQIIMGWTDSHLHQFVADGQFYGVPDPEWGLEDVIEESSIKLKQLLKSEKDSLIYE